MYAIRTTPGFIIDSRTYGEAGKLVSIFTRDLGLITATAAGIRFERSKLRYFAQDCSFGSFSLVRGREFWRLTSASGFTNDSRETALSPAGSVPRSHSPSLAPKVPSNSFLNPSSRELIARIALILRRLLQGEEPNAPLFESVQAAIDFLGAHELDPEQLKTLESLAVMRIMHRLGYIGDAADLDGHAASSDISLALLDSLRGSRTAMNRHINAALKESHL